MIDNELDQLSRALIAATDRLNSEDFRERQARLVLIEEEAEAVSIRHERQRQQILADFRAANARLNDEREGLAAILEADERAVEAAQAALTQHIASTYLASDLTQDEPADEGDDELFEDITPIPTEEEASWREEESARGGGGLNDIPN